MHKWLLALGMTMAGCSLTYARESLSPEALRHYATGKLLLRQHKDVQAQAELLRAIQLSPQFVEAHRLYQDACVRLCKIRPLVQKYEQMLRSSPKNAEALYLNGRLCPDPDEQERLFSQAVSCDVGSPWGYFGLAHVAVRRQRFTQAEDLYKKASALWRDQNPLGFTAVGVVQLRRGQNKEAAEAFRRAAEMDPEDGSVWHFHAKALARLNQYPEAISAVLNAIRCNPHNTDVHDSCRTLLNRLGIPKDFQATVEVCRTAIQDHPDVADLYLTLALAQHRSGDTEAALLSYDKARSLGASPSDYANDMRLLHVRRRQYAKALQVWQAKAPRDLVFTEGNVARLRFEHMVRATSEAEAAPSNLPAQLALARAYESIGWIDEAAAQYRTILSLAPEDQDARLAQERLRRHQQFCRRIRGLFESNYFRFASGKGTMSLSQAVRRVCQLAKDILRTPIEGRTETINYTFLGEVTDFRFPPRSGLQKYFWERGQFFAIGQATGEPVQCVLLNAISWEPGRRASLWGRVLTHDRLVCENADLRGLDEVMANARIGGQTVDRFYYINIDRVWESVAASVELERRLGERLRLAAQEPPQTTEPLKVRYLSCLPEVLRHKDAAGTLRLGEGTQGDPAQRLFHGVLSAIDTHELGHVLDALSYVPVSKHFLEALLLLVKHGFSARNLLAMTERNAQLTALAHAEEPRSVLAGTLSFVVRDMELTAHTRGYFELTRSLVGYIASHPQRFSTINAHDRILDQFSRLQPEDVRRLAWDVARQYGLPQRAAKVLHRSAPSEHEK